MTWNISFLIGLSNENSTDRAEKRQCWQKQHYSKNVAGEDNVWARRKSFTSHMHCWGTWWNITLRERERERENIKSIRWINGCTVAPHKAHIMLYNVLLWGYLTCTKQNEHKLRLAVPVKAHNNSSAWMHEVNGVKETWPQVSCTVKTGRVWEKARKNKLLCNGTCEENKERGVSGGPRPWPCWGNNFNSEHLQ